MARTTRASTPATQIVVKTAGYYLVLVLIGWLVWRVLPGTSDGTRTALESLMGAGRPFSDSRNAGFDAAPGEVASALTVALAMVSAILLALPVAWVYILTRAKRGYQQSVVQSLILLPLVVSGVVLLVKHSLALAFSLAGIVAAVRFRNTLDDSKDAVYIFLATGIGLAAAVNVPIAAVISAIFNAAILALWHTDFGNAPPELEGRIAEQRLQRAKELAQTGTFVAQIDTEVLSNMNRDQLEGVAERAWRRARGTEGDSAESKSERRLRLRTRDVEIVRAEVESRLDDHTKDWRSGGIVMGNDGIDVIDYFVTLGKKHDADDLLAFVRRAGSTDLIDAELT